MQRLFLKKKEGGEEKCPASLTAGSYHGMATAQAVGITESGDGVNVSSRTDGGAPDTSVVPVSGSGTRECQESIPTPECSDLTQ